MRFTPVAVGLLLVTRGSAELHPVMAITKHDAGCKGGGVDFKTAPDTFIVQTADLYCATHLERYNARAETLGAIAREYK
ncbi:hypothetical protein PCANC_17803 [Puccinia coronata f. sp. avenae]|uniref:Uncharacterized protein n=1 Tax=Puccinia coronata f. sp. avenae TaxID=200324 RepID=A0A2N5SI90_9BASI|nr:hypothetical protein PCANC_17803 [Puccinia coronata f. sp. avenae]PLW16043.1 hypothetical protein PCASD_20698 [Puccinia coronata f. sp. avenae]PLW46144.1 hypothetical protein PCASD_04172 [Puccinia coronata f. sp. avenae]